MFKKETIADLKMLTINKIQLTSAYMLSLEYIHVKCPNYFIFFVSGSITADYTALGFLIIKLPLFDSIQFI